MLSKFDINELISSASQKSREYETVVTRYIWVAIFIAFLSFYSVAIKNGDQISLTSNVIPSVAIIGLIVGMNLYKMKNINNTSVSLIKYLSLKILSTLLVITGIEFYVSADVNIGIIIPSVIVVLANGKRYGLIMYYTAFIYHMALKIGVYVFEYSSSLTIYEYVIDANIMPLLFFYVLFLMTILICNAVYETIQKADKSNAELIEELLENNEALTISEEQNRQNYKELEATHREVETVNTTLNKTVAELYTLKMINNVINSIKDPEVLYDKVIDIILGVTGANYVTILTLASGNACFNLEGTNIYNGDADELFNNLQMCSRVKNSFKSLEPLYINEVDEEYYTFTKGRNIASIIFVPLVAGNDKIGILIIEQTKAGAFKESNENLLSEIAKQVSIAVSNANLYRELEVAAITDSLTKIYNRLYFHKKLMDEFDYARAHKTDLGMVIFDVDHFKKVNDTYGHMFGDRVLIRLCEYVSERLGDDQVFARFGGEEFVILFPNKSKEELYREMDSLRKEISTLEFHTDEHRRNITISIGLASYPNDADNVDELLIKADEALYQAKNMGRNKVCAAK